MKSPVLMVALSRSSRINAKEQANSLSKISEPGIWAGFTSASFSFEKLGAQVLRKTG